MKSVTELYCSKVINDKGEEYDIIFDKKRNSKFFVELNKFMDGYETNLNEKICIDEFSIKNDFWNNDIINKKLTLNSFVLAGYSVGDQGIDWAYEFKMEFYIQEEDFFNANVLRVPDSATVSISNLIVNIIPFQKIKFLETE